MKEKYRIYVLMILGIFFAYILFQSYHYDNIFKTFIFIIVGGSGLYIFCSGIFNDLEKYKKTKKLESYTLTIVGTLLVILNLGIFSYYEIKVNTKSLLKTEYGNIIAAFKSDKNYIIQIGRWASKTYLIGIDKNGNEIRNSELIVIEDNRE